MDELTLLRRLDADAPAPTEAALTDAFDALTERMTAAEHRDRAHAVPRRRTRRPGRRRLVALTALGAAALVAALVMTDTIGVAGLRPGASAQAAELLDHAASATIRTVDPTVGPDQYEEVVRRSVHLTETGNTAGDTVLFSIDENRTTWIPADLDGVWTEVRYPVRSAGDYWGVGAKEAAEWYDAQMRDVQPQVLHGRAGAFFGANPDKDPEAVDGLPRDPRVLLNHIYRVALGGSSPNDEALVFIADTLNTGYADASLRAALYRAAALIPGVTLSAGSATLDGTTGVAIGRTEPSTGIRQELIIAPDTGMLIGERRIATRELDDGLTPAGTTLGWSSVTTTVVDDLPKQYRS